MMHSTGSISFNESRPALTDMEPLAEKGRALLLGGTGVATLLSVVGIAPPAGAIPPAAGASPAPLSLRLADGPLSALSTIETVTRGVGACRRWIAGATALVSGAGGGSGRGGLDGASSTRLVQELQANRQLPYAVDGDSGDHGGGNLRATLAHELSLKAPEHPELAHHLGTVGGFGAANGMMMMDEEEADGMAGAIDIGDAGWASNSDLDGSGGAAAAALGSIDLGVVAAASPAVAATAAAAAARGQQERHNGGSGGSGLRNGDGTRTTATPSARSTLLQTASVARAVPPPLFTNSAAPTTRGSRNQRTSPFNLKACSSCKKGRISAIKCRVDLQHWEDPDWTDPPSRPWVMPDGFVEWVAKVDGGPDGNQPGSPTNRATAAAAAAFREAALAEKAAAAGSGAGPRVAVTESASALLDRMLGAAALPPPVPAPVARTPIPAPRTAPGAPAPGGPGLKRTRCLAAGCGNPVGRDVAFCSDDCVVAAQRQAVQALVAYHQKQQAAAAAGASKKAAAEANGGGGNVGGDAVAAIDDGSGGAAGTGGGRGSGGSTAGGEEGKKTAAAAATAAPKWTADDEESFAKGLEAVRARSAQTSGQRLRHKIMDLFRELFAEGMAELGVGSDEAAVLSGVLAWDLEHELNAFSRTNRDVYKEKAKSLRFNIKFAKNPELFKVGARRDGETEIMREGGVGVGGSRGFRTHVGCVWITHQ